MPKQNRTPKWLINWRNEGAVKAFMRLRESLNAHELVHSAEINKLDLDQLMDACACLAFFEGQTIAVLAATDGGVFKSEYDLATNNAETVISALVSWIHQFPADIQVSITTRENAVALHKTASSLIAQRYSQQRGEA
jgi:hypothetical protein